MTDPATTQAPPAGAPPAAPVVIATRRVAGVMRDNPGLMLTAAYLLMTFVGLSYDFWLFLYFRIPIVYYAEPSDFLAAGLREPAAVLLCLLPLALVWMFAVGDRWLRRRSERYAARQARYATTRWASPVLQLAMWSIFVLIYGFVFTQMYAERTARTIKAGGARRVRVELNGNGLAAGAAALPALRDTAGAVLLGTTSRFLFLYYPADSVTHVVPVDNVARIIVPARRKR